MALPDLSALDLGEPTGPIVRFTDEYQRDVSRRTRAGCARRAAEGDGEVCMIAHEPLLHGQEVYQLPEFEGRPGAFVGIREIYAWWASQRRQGYPMTNPTIPRQQVDDAEWAVVRDWVLAQQPPASQQVLFPDGIIEKQPYDGAEWERLLPGIDPGLLSHGGGGIASGPGSMLMHGLAAAVVNKRALFSRIGRDVEFTWRQQRWEQPAAYAPTGLVNNDFLIRISAEPNTVLHTQLTHWGSAQGAVFRNWIERGRLLPVLERALGLPPGRLSSPPIAPGRTDESHPEQLQALKSPNARCRYYHPDGTPYWGWVRPNDPASMKVVLEIEIPMWLMRNVIVGRMDPPEWPDRASWSHELLSPDHLEGYYEERFGTGAFFPRRMDVAETHYFQTLKWGVLIAQAMIAHAHAAQSMNPLYFLTSETDGARMHPAVLQGRFNMFWGGANGVDQYHAEMALGLRRGIPPVVPDWYDPQARPGPGHATRVLWGQRHAPGASPDEGDLDAFCRAGDYGLPQVALWTRRDDLVMPESTVLGAPESRLVEHKLTTRIPLWYVEYVE